MMMRPDWKSISEACPDPLPKDNAAMDELVMTHRPDLWTKHQFRPKWGRKKRKLRKSFEGQVMWFRWKQKNPHASCRTCAHREEYSASETGYACGLGFEGGGWFTPARDDFVCANFMTPTTQHSKQG